MYGGLARKRYVAFVLKKIKNLVAYCCTQES